VVYSEIDERPAGFSKLWLQTELRGRMGFQGAIFSDDLSMEGASIMGDMPARARSALAAGCDVLPICNNPEAVLVTLEALKDCADPLSQIRLVRLHGRAAPSREELLSGALWAEARQAVQQCLEKPDFALG
jgi:beta-N-acetylhexosaminidase